MSKRTCSIPGCESLATSRGMCPKHYERMKRCGTAEDPPKRDPLCTVEGCERLVRAHRMCNMHYQRFCKHGSTDKWRERTKHVGCSVDGCVGAHKCRGLCQKHYRTWRAHGDPLARYEHTEEHCRKISEGIKNRPASQKMLPLLFGLATKDKADDELTPKQLKSRLYYRSRREEIREQQRLRRAAWRADNVEEARMLSREWNRKNKPAAAKSSAKYQRTPQGRYNLLNSAATSRNLELDLAFDEWLAIADNPCTYCGEPPFANRSGYGLDRIDNARGYTADNVVPCCATCNKMRMNLTQEQFLTQIRKIPEFTAA